MNGIQDHLITMTQSLNHYEKILSRSHSNYLAQISIEMTDANNQINDVLSKLTALGTVLIPMNLITGTTYNCLMCCDKHQQFCRFMGDECTCARSRHCRGSWRSYVYDAVLIKMYRVTRGSYPLLGFCLALLSLGRFSRIECCFRDD